LRKKEELQKRGNEIREMREQAHNKKKHDLEEEIKRLDARHKAIKD